MGVVAAGLHPVDARADPARDRACDHLQRLRKAVVRIRHRRRVSGDLRDAIERGERGLRGRIDERQMRLIDGHVRRDARRALPRCLRLDAAVRAGKRVFCDAWNRGNANRPCEERARGLAHGRPRRQRIDRRRHAIQIAAEPADALRRRRVAGRPDVGALEVRAARVVVAGALDDREPAGVEDRAKVGEARVEAERDYRRCRSQSAGRWPQESPGSAGARSTADRCTESAC